MQPSGKDTTNNESTSSTESILKHLTAYAEACEKKGIFPYEGQWLSSDEVDERIRRKHLTSRIQLIELGSLFALVYVFVILMWLLLSTFTY